MVVLSPDVLMVGSSAVSASCCVAVPERSSAGARLAAVLMWALMVVKYAELGPLPQMLLASGVVVAAVAGSVRSLSGERCGDGLHRSAGAALMVLLVFLQVHAASMPAAGAMAHMPGMAGDDAMPTHDLVALRVLQIASLAFALSTLLIVRRSPRDTKKQWAVQGEHAFMAASVILMAFAGH